MTIITTTRVKLNITLFLLLELFFVMQSCSCILPKVVVSHRYHYRDDYNHDNHVELVVEQLRHGEWRQHQYSNWSLTNNFFAGLL